LGVQKPLVFTKIAWSDQVAGKLRKALGEDEPIIAEEVKRGVSECWNIEGCGLMVTRLEIDQDRKTLVIVAGQGKNAGLVWDKVPAIAKANGANWIRVHSKRPGMVRILEPRGYTTEYGLGENVFIKRV
jgi:hypothetical protein